MENGHQTITIKLSGDNATVTGGEPNTRSSGITPVQDFSRTAPHKRLTDMQQQSPSQEFELENGLVKK